MKNNKSYSVAIRTLGTAGDKYYEELISLHNQTVKPDKIIAYIAEGYERPQRQIGMEEYVWVPKGMVYQRALQYSEIDSDYVLLLDDDVWLAPNSVEELLCSAQENNADCVAADTFKNQEMSNLSKLKAILTNWIMPRTDDGWAFKISLDGGFSYNNNPKNTFYLSQSCAGPAALWKKASLLAIHYEHELWMEDLKYPHWNDMIHSYKLYKNGYKLGVLYGCDIKHLDAAVSSQKFKNSPKRLYFRSMGMFAVWYRAIFTTSSSLIKPFVSVIFAFKAVWLFLVHLMIMVPTRSLLPPYYYLYGLVSGIRFVNTHKFKSLPPYVLKDKKV